MSISAMSADMKVLIEEFKKAQKRRRYKPKPKVTKSKKKGKKR